MKRSDFSLGLLMPLAAWSLLGSAAALAQSSADGPASLTNPAAAPSPADAPAGAVATGASDLDKLLDMADKNVEGLGHVNVSATGANATPTNPVVEGVSKKEETLSESPGIVDVITAKDIEQFGAKNLFEVLQRATSTFPTGSFLFRRNVVSIRGNLQNHEDNHVLILINGRPFRDTTLGGINFSVYTAFPIQTIERIEVIRGPGSVLYGTNAFDGEINIVTKDPDKPTFYASTLNGSYGWQSYSAGGGSGNETQGAYAGTTYSRSQGWPFTASSEDPPGPNGPTTRSAPWGEDNVGVFAMYRNQGFTCNLFAANATEEVLSPLAQWPSEKLNDPRVFCDLGYAVELDDWQSVSLNFTYNYDGVNFPSGFGTLVHPRSNSYLTEATYRVHLSDNLDLLTGGLVDFHEGDNPSSLPPDPIPEFSEIWYGVYAQLEYQALDWLKLIGGMQGNMPGDIPGGIVPRFGAIASMNESWTGKFLYGQAFRSPYQLERSIDVPGVLIGNPDLVPETIQTFDVQLAYHTNEFRFAATYFHSDYFDIITRTSALPQTYLNGGKMTFDGVELENQWNFAEHWRCLGSTTYQFNVRDGIDNTTSAPNWMAKLGLAYFNDAGFTAGLFDSFFGDQTVPPTAEPLNKDPQANHLVSLNTTLDLDRALNWHTGRTMRLQFLIDNLLNESVNNVEFERELINSFPAEAGRTYYGGVTVSF